MQTEKTKKCAKCKVPKPLKLFRTHAGSNDGYRRECASCEEARKNRSGSLSKQSTKSLKTAITQARQVLKAGGTFAKVQLQPDKGIASTLGGLLLALGSQGIKVTGMNISESGRLKVTYEMTEEFDL